jgi:hypothetical protein
MTQITLTKTESSRNGVAFIEGDQDIGYETAAIVASASPLGLISMGTFPSSLIAWAGSRRRHFYESGHCECKHSACGRGGK